MAEPSRDAVPFRVVSEGGHLAGHVGGRGPRLLMLHGGPMSDYLEPLAASMRDKACVATYQQRGLAPSSVTGPFTVADHVRDVVSVLDHLGWDRPVLMGHSWGAHLLLHLLVSHPERVAGALLVDPLGGVGDGGYAEFGAEMGRRTPADRLARAKVLDARLMAGQATPQEATESVELFWPAYFAEPEHAPPFPGLQLNAVAAAATLSSAAAALADLTPRLPRITTPTVFVHGERSPMPISASRATAAAIGPASQVLTVPGAGHFPWIEAPGCLDDPLQQLLNPPAATPAT